jgi:hypothetical protein
VYRNSNDCPHCGRIFARRTEMTPVVNRSDGETFHVSLYSGPSPRPRSSGGFYAEQLICGFGYAFDQIGPKTYFVLVIILLNAEEDADDVLRQIEEAADKITELVDTGRRLTAVYTFDGGRLLPGFPN